MTGKSISKNINLFNNFSNNKACVNTTIISTVKSDPALSPSRSQQPSTNRSKFNKHGISIKRNFKVVPSKKSRYTRPILNNKNHNLNKSKIFQMSLAKCAGCDMPILDQYLYNVLDRPWHQSCIQCNDCKLSLNDKCFSREGKIFCKDDFIRYFF